MRFTGRVFCFLIVLELFIGASGYIGYRETTLREGWSSYLGCAEHLHPGSKQYLSWEYDGKTIHTGGRFNETSFGLRIDDVQLSDEGIYTCKVKNENNGEIYEEEIRVNVDPGSLEIHVFPEFSNIYKTVGESLAVICIVTDLGSGSKIDSISWIDPQGRNLSASNSSRLTILQKTSKDSVLYLKDIRSADAGKYSCRVKTSIGSVSNVTDENFVLEVYEQSAVRMVFSTDAVIRGKHYHTLRCSGLSDTNQAIAWKRNGEDLYTEMIMKYLSAEGNQPDVNYHLESEGLHLRDVSESDAGIYTCRQRNATTGVITEQKFNVTVSVDPTAAVSSAEITGRLHSRVLLGCVAHGNPKPIIEWRFGYKTIEQNDRYSITDAGLVINKAVESDSGSYYCKARQPEFSIMVEKEIRLTVKPSTLEDVVDLQEQTLTALNKLIAMHEQQQHP